MAVPTRFDREVCRRVPLAEACGRLLDFGTHADFLDDVCARHRGRSYEDVISSPLFVHLLGEALLQHQASAQQSFCRAREDGDLQASLQAAYGKRARVPLGLSRGFLFEAAARVRLVFPPVRPPLPSSLATFQMVAFDGQKSKDVARRLQPLRRLKGPFLGGQRLVGLHLNSQLVLAFQAHADGHFGDAGWVEGLLGLDAATYPAEDLLAVYQLRWGIEGCFQQSTEVFDLGHLLGSTPQATVWQAAFCLLWYNVTLVVRGYLAEARARPPAEISSELVFADMRRQLIAWDEVLTPAAPVALPRGPWTAAQRREQLRALLAAVWTGRWRTAPPQKREPERPSPKQYVKGGHASVYRLLLQARQRVKESRSG